MENMCPYIWDTPRNYYSSMDIRTMVSIQLYCVKTNELTPH